MANEMQRVAVRLLANPETRPAGLAAIFSAMISAVNGDEESASAALAMCAEIFRQDVEFPGDARYFLVKALDEAAKSSEVCKGMAGTTGKPGRSKNKRRDIGISCEEVRLRDEYPKKKDRVALLMKRHNLGEDGINTILKAYSQRSRDIKIAKLLAKADALIKKAETEG